jgi:hypothetical protein
MTLTVQYVPLTYVAQTWPLVEGYIADAFAKSNGDDYTVEQVKVFVSIGQWLLLVARDEQGEIHGAATSSFINYPNDRIAFITSIGGRLISNQDTFKQMSDILKANGATKIQGMARPSIARLWKRYGFKERTMLVETRI